jgi:NADH-quinone oxidoreductase subunit H
MFVSGAVMATLYFGGYDFPGYSWVLANWGANAANIMGVGAIFSKALFFIFFFMWIRWTIPRFRYDQLMGLGWNALIPLSMFNVVVTGASILLNWPATIMWGTLILSLVIALVYDIAVRNKKKKVSTT